MLRPFDQLLAWRFVPTPVQSLLLSSDGSRVTCQKMTNQPGAVGAILLQIAGDVSMSSAGLASFRYWRSEWAVSSGAAAQHPSGL